MHELTEAQKKAKEIRFSEFRKKVSEKKMALIELENEKNQLIKDNKFDYLTEQKHDENVKNIKIEIYDINEKIKEFDRPGYEDRNKQIQIEINNKNTKKELKKKFGEITAIIVISFFLIYWLFFFEDRHKSKPQQKNTDTLNIEKQFSSWNGEHILLSISAKQYLKYPDTYDHIETKYWDNKEAKSITVKSYFNGKNAFGVPQRQCLIATYSYFGSELKTPETCI